MCIIRNLFGLKVTAHDKLDLLMVVVTYTDLIWLIGDMSHSFHSYHLIVLMGLGIGAILGSKILYKLMQRHHKAWVKRHVLYDPSSKPMKISEK